MDLTDMYPTHAHQRNNGIYTTRREVGSTLESNF